jgi:hypothetical protein
MTNHLQGDTMIYRYACRNRPPGYAAVPDGFVAFTDPHPDPSRRGVSRHGEVHYDHALPDLEAERYELVRLYDPDPGDTALYTVDVCQLFENGQWADTRPAPEIPWGVGWPRSMAAALAARINQAMRDEGYDSTQILYVLRPLP